MNLVKDETTAQLDEVMSLADETIDLYADLAGHLQRSGVRAALEAAIDEQRRLLHALRASRQARDDLPQAGDPERAHLRALVAEVHAFLKSVTTRSENGNEANRDEPLIESLRQATRHLQTELESATRCRLPADEIALLERLWQSCKRLEGGLRKQS